MKKQSGREEEAQNQKIAVIEEIADDIYSIKFILQSIGYDVDSFASCNALQDTLSECSPQLIIIDMMIPDGEAYQIIQELGQSRLKKVPILAITAEAMAGEEQDVYKAGGQDVLARPYEISDLRKKLKKWLQ